MTKKPKLLPCVCGNGDAPTSTTDESFFHWIACRWCDARCEGNSLEETTVMWNASMKALAEIKNAKSD